MAHENIDERREAVAAALQEHGGKIPPSVRHSIAADFGCSTAAVNADVLILTRTESISPYTTPKMRKRIAERDGVCQYCLKVRGMMVTEHVIPAIRGGVARDYNLVLACQSCNCRKGNDVWIPNNLDVITKNHPEWKRRVLERASQT